MATRQMVGQRKGPPTTVADDASRPPDSADSRDGENPDVVTCPNCDCEFDEHTLDVVTPGKPLAEPVEGEGYQGADLDTSGSEHPTPGKMGTAADAARGEQAIGNLLSNLRAKV